MNLFAITKTQEAGGQIALASLLGMAGVFLLLPRPRGRFVAGGIAALIAAAAVFGAWTYRTFGNPLPDVVGAALFWLFAAGALGFGAVLVVQKNPARGAIAFAFVVLSTCGLFLLLAAPFLMAATIIIYAGAIIVTFLFVLMLSPSNAASNENDRSREPLYGSFAGFAFVGLVLFSLYQTSRANDPAEPGTAKFPSRLPAPVITADERNLLADAVAKLNDAESALDGDAGTFTARVERLKAFDAAFAPAKKEIMSVVGISSREEAGNINYGTLRVRLEKEGAKINSPAVLFREDPQARAELKQAATVRDLSYDTAKRVEQLVNGKTPDVPAAKAEVRHLRDEVVLLYGTGDLPADNVRNLGLVLYSEHLLAIELAGTLLLVAVIGAIAIAHKKREGVPGEPVGGSPVRAREVEPMGGSPYLKGVAK